MDRMTSTTCSSSSNPPPSFGTEAFLLPGNNNTRTRSSSLPGSPASSSPSKASSTKSPSTSSSSSSARKTNSLPLETVEYLKAWMMSPEHVAHPYPTEQEKAKIMADTGIELKQLTNWFVNNRKRFWKPRVEARLQQHEGSSSGSGAALATVVPPPTPGANNSNTAKASAPVGRPAPHLVTPTVVTPLKKVSSSSGIIALSDLTLGSALAAAGYGYLLEPQTSATSTTTTTTTTKLTPSSSSSSLNSSPARVSDHSVDSSASETDSVCSSSADEYHISLAASLPSQVTTAGGERTAEATSSNHLLTQTEYVNVHILRPSSHNNSSIGTTVVPTIDDVVVLHNVPADRVLKSFVNCPLTYSVPMQDLNNSHKVRSVDGRALRIDPPRKKHFYLTACSTESFHVFFFRFRFAATRKSLSSRPCTCTNSLQHRSAILASARVRPRTRSQRLPPPPPSRPLPPPQQQVPRAPSSDAPVWTFGGKRVRNRIIATMTDNSRASKKPPHSLVLPRREQSETHKTLYPQDCHLGWLTTLVYYHHYYCHHNSFYCKRPRKCVPSLSLLQSCPRAYFSSFLLPHRRVLSKIPHAARSSVPPFKAFAPRVSLSSSQPPHSILHVTPQHCRNGHRS